MKRKRKKKLEFQTATNRIICSQQQGKSLVSDTSGRPSHGPLLTQQDDPPLFYTFHHLAKHSFSTHESLFLTLHEKHTWCSCMSVCLSTCRHTSSGTYIAARTRDHGGGRRAVTCLWRQVGQPRSRCLLPYSWLQLRGPCRHHSRHFKLASHYFQCVLQRAGSQHH